MAAVRTGMFTSPYRIRQTETTRRKAQNLETNGKRTDKAKRPGDDDVIAIQNF
jgi:hypothetical protein